MNIDEVIDLVNNHLTYKSGWHVTAERSLGGVGGNIIIRTRRMTEDSTPGSIEKVEVTANYWLKDTSGMDEMTVKAHITFALAIAELHDVFEFVRFDGHAPFHPHRDDGLRAIQDKFDLDFIKDKGRGK